MASKQNTVSKKTFLEWSNNDDFDFDVDINNDLTFLKCKICTVHLAEIRREERKHNIREPVLDGILNYTDSVHYIHNANFHKYYKAGSLQGWAKKTFKKDQNQPRTSQQTTPITLETNQQTIFLSVGNTAKDNYTRLIRTALHIAIKEKHFSDFPDLIKLQQSTGLKFVTSKTHKKACAQFIEILANVIRADINNILQTSNFFLSIFDGSQPKKTFSEKELLYVKVAIRGKVFELLC